MLERNALKIKLFPYNTRPKMKYHHYVYLANAMANFC